MKLYPETKALIVTLLLFFTSLSLLKYTKANFSDSEKLLGNSIEVGVWNTTPSPSEPINTPTLTPILDEEAPEITSTPTPTNIPITTPTSTPTPVSSVAGSVVINELMWMGSHESTSDEWIELKNTTSTEIDLTGWVIINAGSGSNSIVLSGSIPTSGFFLISHYPSSTSSINNSITVDQVVAGIELGNDGEQLVLKNSGEVIIDQTPSGSWPAGINGTSSNPDQSMERNNDPSTGWHTCTDSACHSTTYWDIDGLNWGTPKTQNI